MRNFLKTTSTWKIQPWMRSSLSTESARIDGIDRSRGTVDEGIALSV